MTTTDHGPGVTWLAQRAGREPDELVRDLPALLDALTGAARDAASLAARLGSDDPVVRRRAEAEARAVRARMNPPGGPTAGERFGQKVAEAMRAEAERLRREAAEQEAS